jgi:hypothetical protein
VLDVRLHAGERRQVAKLSVASGPPARDASREEFNTLSVASRTVPVFTL